MQALCVIIGILFAIWLTARRYRAAGGAPGVIGEIAAWTIPAALIPVLAGLLLAHGRSHQTHALRVLDEVLGFPGAVAFGLAGAALACREMSGARRSPAPLMNRGVPGGRPPGLAQLLAAAAPAIAFGHAVASLSTWVTQQAYGRPSSLWWAVRISPDHRLPGYENYATFQPVFLYQVLWDVTTGVAVIIAIRKLKLSGDRAFALVMAGYATGGLFLGLLRIGQLPVVLGIRAGELGDGALLIVALGYLWRSRGTGKTRVPLRPLETDSSGDVMSA
jgi:prolipoprotein diacylglyceryltransferase